VDVDAPSPAATHRVPGDASRAAQSPALAAESPWGGPGPAPAGAARIRSLIAHSRDIQSHCQRADR
jgi:hypothetical protein